MPHIIRMLVYATQYISDRIGIRRGGMLCNGSLNSVREMKECRNDLCSYLHGRGGHCPER
jgi:hypothetical protein